MRISRQQGDPGYATLCRLRDNNEVIIIYLNGVEQHDVHTADTLNCQIGFVVRYKRDVNGELLLKKNFHVFEHFVGHVMIAHHCFGRNKVAHK